jgi:hypothetical protein
MDTTSDSSGAATSPVNMRDWTIKNPDGWTPNFSYDILKRRRGEREHSCLAYARSKLRAGEQRLHEVAPHRDMVAHQVILPPDGPDLFMSAQTLWTTVDTETNWDGEPHMMAGPTIWFPQVRSQHWALRQVAAFAQAELADRLGVAVHLIAHAPSRIAHAADFHVHLLCTARQVHGSGLGSFAPDLLYDGCQIRSKARWDQWWAANAMPR